MEAMYTLYHLKKLSEKIKFLDNAKVWKCLGPVLGDASLVSRGEAYATVAVKFSTTEGARKNSDKTLKTEEAVLLPSYMGRRTSRIRIEDVPPETEVTSGMAALLRGRDDKVSFTNHQGLGETLVWPGSGSLGPSVLGRTGKYAELAIL